MPIEFVEFGEAVRELKCHKCNMILKKGTSKVKADMGRRSSMGHIWFYQLCYGCAIKAVDDEEKRLKQIKDEIMEKIERDKKNKIMEEKRKWL